MGSQVLASCKAGGVVLRKVDLRVVRCVGEHVLCFENLDVVGNLRSQVVLGVEVPLHNGVLPRLCVLRIHDTQLLCMDW